MVKRKTKPPNPLSGMDRHGLPTLEQVRKGGYCVTAWKENGVGRETGKVVRNTASTPIMRAHSRGVITDRMKDAADRYYWLILATRVTGGRRDSLDMTPRGGHEALTDERLAWLADRESERCLLAEMVPHDALRVVHSVVVDEDAIGACLPDRRRYQLLCAGLSALADLWKMPEEDAS
jgi:hypothetical protein